MKWCIAVLAALVLVLQYRIWLSPRGAREVLQLDSAVQQQADENQRLKARNQQFAAEVRDLAQGYEALEERARSELGLISAKDETYYQALEFCQGGTRRGIDSALKFNGTKLNGLLVPPDVGQTYEIAAQAGYPMITIPAGVHSSGGMPFGLGIMQTAFRPNTA